MAWANHGTSSIDKAASVTCQAGTKMDSGRAYFYYPTEATIIDSFAMLPFQVAPGVNDSLLLVGTIPQGALTAIGTYRTKIALYEQGATAVSRYTIGTWDNNYSVDSINAGVTIARAIEDSTGKILDSTYTRPTAEEIASIVDDTLTDQHGAGDWETAILTTPTDTNESGDTIARLGDSIPFQGPGSSLTAEEIASIVDDTLSDQHGAGDWETAIVTTPTDTNESGDTIARLGDSIPFQGPGSSLTAEEIASIVDDTLTDQHGDDSWQTAIVTTPTDTNESGDTVARLKDSIPFQGGASGLTAEEIASVVDDTLSTNHGAGSWESAGLGTGPNNLTIFAVDSSGPDTLTDITVYVRNQTGTLEAAGQTDTEGAVTFKLSNGTWIVQAGQNVTRYHFDDTTYTVSLPYDTAAILGYPTFIPQPTDSNKAPVFAWLYDFLGNPVEGIVVTLALEVNVNVTATANGITVGRNNAMDTTDVDGFFRFDPYRSMVYDDSTKALYNIRGYDGINAVFILDSFYVPDTGFVDITDSLSNR